MAKKIINQEIVIRTNFLIEESGDNWTCVVKGCYKPSAFVTHITFYWGNFSETKDRYWCSKHLKQIFKTNEKLLKTGIPHLITNDV